MIDRFGRVINYLRLSVTERCTLKCEYCRTDDSPCAKHSELSAEQLVRIVTACAELGITKLRLTGGEPLLRDDIVDIVSGCAAIAGIEEIALTTNAQQLGGMASRLKAAGLNRLNISIDSLKPEKFRAITGGGDLKRVLDGVDEAIENGLLPIRLNVVVVRGRNDGEIDDFIALTKHRPIDVRFIELMPIGRLGEDPSLRVLSSSLISERPYLIPEKPDYTGQPAINFSIDGYAGRVGFISPISHKFCAECNRVRIMSDGMLRPCLGNNSELSLLSALSDSDKALTETIRDAIYNKPQGHNFENAWKTEKNMNRIGG